MNQFTVYRADRGEGKTTWIIDQVAGLLSTAVGPLDIAIVVPAESFRRQYIDRHIPIAIYTEHDFIHARGRRHDIVFVDNADLFYENPLDICDVIAPGKPAFLTYTPFSGSSLPKPPPNPERQAEYLRQVQEDTLMLAFMLAYIKYGALE